MLNSTVMLNFLVQDQKYPIVQFRSNNQNYLVELKVVTKIISSVLTLIVMFAFFCFRPKYSFWVNLTQKNKIVSFKLKFGTKTNSNVLNSLVMLTLSCSIPKILFLGKFNSTNQNCLK